MKNFSPPGWYLLPLEYTPDDVGCWLLHHNGEALLLEFPYGLKKKDVVQGLEEINSKLYYYTASHCHEDHFWEKSFNKVVTGFKNATFIPFEPFKCQVQHLTLGGEPLYLVDGPKHSESDRITIFRGVAMTGDVELGTLDTCNGEIEMAWRKKAMAFFGSFERTFDYQVHTAFSAHRNSCRLNVNFSGLFDV